MTTGSVPDTNDLCLSPAAAAAAAEVIPLVLLTHVLSFPLKITN